jgi:hypothetical protein
MPYTHAEARLADAPPGIGHGETTNRQNGREDVLALGQVQARELLKRDRAEPDGFGGLGRACRCMLPIRLRGKVLDGVAARIKHGASSPRRCR